MIYPPAPIPIWIRTGALPLPITQHCNVRHWRCEALGTRSQKGVEHTSAPLNRSD